MMMMMMMMTMTSTTTTMTTKATIPELASAENSKTAIFTIFASKSTRIKNFKVFLFKKVFFTIVELGKSKHSELFGPPFSKTKIFFA